MLDHLKSFQLWALAQIVSSLSWPISFMTVSSLAAFVDLSEPSLPILWLLGFVMGWITVLTSGLFVGRQISSKWKWAIANFVGIPVSLTVAYLIFPFATSPSRFAAVGILSGLIASAAQSLSLNRQHSKIVPLICGALGWGLAFLFGYILVMQESTATFLLTPRDFFNTLLLGWGVSGPILLILFLGLSPMSHDRTSSGPGITYN